MLEGASTSLERDIEEEDKVLGHDDDMQARKRREYSGAALDKEYVEKIYPKGNTINLEWTVDFTHAGSFFI